MNTPITTLTSVSALCEDYGQGMGETDDTLSLPRMQIDAFHAWLQRADPGACLEYHRGLLSLDRSPDSNLPEARRRALSRVADLALNAAERGRVHLVQRRNGELGRLARRKFWQSSRFAAARSTKKAPRSAGTSASARSEP